MKYIIKIKCDYNYGDTVYLKTDPDQLAYIVVGISYLNSNLFYILSFNGSLNYILPVEITKDKIIVT